MNVLTAPDPKQTQWRATGAVIAWAHAVAGNPSPSGPKGPLWQGSMRELREGAKQCAEHPEAVPETDEAMVAVLDHARPALRAHGFLLSPLQFRADRPVKVARKPKGYRPGPKSNRRTSAPSPTPTEPVQRSERAVAVTDVVSDLAGYRTTERNPNVD